MKLISLLSGGIDSPVASYLMLNKGHEVIPVHFLHQTTNTTEHKIRQLITILAKKTNKTIRAYLIPFQKIQYEIIKTVPPRYRMIVYIRTMLRIAEEILKTEKADAILTGDNLGQVASQTMDNLKAASNGISTPIFRPLLTYNKEDIIKAAREIGTYNISLEEYKDCCSIIAKNPNTKTKVEKLMASADSTKVEDLIRNSMKEVGFYEFR